MTHEILPIRLAVKAMRDSGYKNAAYAVAELIDNSIQAGAKSISLLCSEVERRIDTRTRRQLDEIGVLDDGSGMSAEVLRAALQFGNGQYLENRGGIGRFGMGLPNSSLSQAKRVEVWTWQRGTEPLYSYLDLDKIVEGTLAEVPEPATKAVPDRWKRAEHEWPVSGTLVVWSDLDRCQWRTARALIENSEHMVGRTYRRFLEDGRVSIRMASFSPGPIFDIDKFAQANDPGYLMNSTSCPPPWHDVPMFERWGEPYTFVVKQGGAAHSVVVVFSIAKVDARQGHNPGAEPHGKHAARNVGVSVVRSGRELELQLGWCSRHEARERWWGVEVQIPTALDEVFGVTNDKQSARALADFSTVDLEEMVVREGYASVQELREVWAEGEDPRLVLLDVKQHIEKNLTEMRKKIAAQTARESRGDQRHAPHSAEVRGTEATRKRQLVGEQGTSDEGEFESSELRHVKIAAALEEVGVDPRQAHERARVIVENGTKYEFVHCHMENAAFFSVRPKGGTILIELNTNHPAYDNLVALLEGDPDRADIEKLRERMRKSFDGLKLLLEAWARYEDELPEAQKDRARDARADWGRVARDFLQED